MAAWSDSLFNMRSLAEMFGDEKVMTYRLPPRSPSFRMSSIKSDFYMWSDKEGNRRHLHKWTFRQFLAALARGEPHYCMANGTKNTALRDLLAAQAGSFACIPGGNTRRQPRKFEFFFGSRDAGPGLHHDGAIESFLCQLIGHKRVNIFSPADIPYLYPVSSWLAPTGHFSAVADSFRPDLKSFPLFRKANALSCRLEPGDALYLPPHWYHDTAPQGPTATLTIRHAPPTDRWGTRRERDAIRAAAATLYDRVRRSPTQASAVYIAFLLNDFNRAVVQKRWKKTL